MKRLVFFVSLLCFACVFQSDAQTNLRAIWDYDDTQISAITRFEVKVDTGNWQSIGIPFAELFSTTLPGHHSYVYIIPTVSNGQHSFQVRACDSIECSFEATAPFKLIGPPKNPRVER